MVSKCLNDVPVVCHVSSSTCSNITPKNGMVHHQPTRCRWFQSYRSKSLTTREEWTEKRVGAAGVFDACAVPSLFNYNKLLTARETIKSALRGVR